MGSASPHKRGFFCRCGGGNRGRCCGREAFGVVAAAREDEGQAEGDGKGDAHADDVRRQVLRADGDDAGDARRAQSDGFGFVEGDVGAGAGGADERGVEGVAQAQVDAEHRRFGDAQHGGDAGGGGDAFEFGVAGAEERAEGGRALRDVVHRGDGEDEGAAGVGDVGNELGFNRDEAVVHAGDDHRRVEAAEDGAAENARGVVEPLDGVGEGDTGVARRRPDDGKGEQRGDEDGQARRQQQIDACRDDAAQAAFQFGEYPATDEDGQHGTLVADFGDAKAKNIPVLQRAVGGRLREGIVVGEVGVHHDHAEHRAEVGVAAENAGGREGDEDGEEDEGARWRRC